MNSSKVVQLALQFVGEINSHSPEQLAKLMSEDHLFIDSVGSKVSGRESMVSAWAHYFSMFPDYEMVVEDTMARDNVAALFGTARGTLKVGSEMPQENQWQMPFAALAVVKGNKISQWRIYADNHPVREIMARIRR